ncbi:hypothetical protein [Denitromonas iodatirespirans]|uniref:Uncharacterized protein n=1 Tax=Denitromonas iodatirespirans TaxID=2795389 RepID=A0A944D7U9_DENI1|nr:hypothetical protein [Denitromonas iodatirespirans]MBT0961680.1 hypothetical protein [Denitromonas iodatirespirans]
MTKGILILAFWAFGSMILGYAVFTNPGHDVKFGLQFLGFTMAFMLLGALITLACWKLFS